MIDIRIPATSGNLNGVFHIPENMASTAVLVMCHGFRGSKDGGGRAVSLAEKACRLGLTVLRFDFTPCSTLTRQVSEVGEIIRYTRDRIGDRIILLGRSMGGSASLIYTAQDKSIAGLCLWATPSNLSETFRLALGEQYNQLAQGRSVSLDDEYGKRTLSPEFVADFANYNLITCVERLPDQLSLLQVHGTQDAIVSQAQAEDIYHAASVRKKLVIINGGDHQFSQHADEASGAVIEWLKTVI